MKAVFWHDETMGADYVLEEIPAGLVDEAEQWRDKMLEKVAEYDDDLMSKYFDDPSTITEEEIKRALRKATLSMDLVPMICGSSFKNKGVQYLLDAVCAYLPSPVDAGEVEGRSVDNPDEVVTRHPSSDAPLCRPSYILPRLLRRYGCRQLYLQHPFGQEGACIASLPDALK